MTPTPIASLRAPPPTAAILTTPTLTPRTTPRLSLNVKACTAHEEARCTICRSAGGRLPKSSSSSTSSGKKTKYNLIGLQKVAYSYPGDWKRYAVSKVHGLVWCPWCPRTNGLKGPGTYSRVRDSPKGHLKTCDNFVRSKYYKAAGGTTYDREEEAKGEEVDWKKKFKAADWRKHEEIVASALIKFAVVVPCINDWRYKARLREQGLTNEDVLAELQPRATVYKYGHCLCCPLPPVSTFKDEE
ncbi:hypothetical protein BN946_scf185042.g169 [Trametes cinnabarina]|uniref:Uncharacterized protein n=1 Tax=Pycnoporus cinnabarinus TaxID=5643 RepID=A0A060S4C1_PYCCI|nr:hypothetical protein BN946_scf185042.g169 [Trametes cinnabarina]